MGATTTVYNIQERTLEFTVRASALCDALLSTKRMSAQVIGKQLFRSAASIGANMHEADAAQSRADFIHKVSISHKEANETIYWLRVVERTAMISPERLVPLVQETNEIIAILVTILKNAKRNSDK